MMLHHYFAQNWHLNYHFYHLLQMAHALFATRVPSSMSLPKATSGSILLDLPIDNALGAAP
jgi:hypothetical protein